MLETIQAEAGVRQVSRELSDKELDGVAQELVQVERSTGWTRVLGIGKIVLARFFGGDCREWASRKRNKVQSIRRLAERPRCPLQKTALTEAVGVYILHRERPAISDSEHLTPSHAAAVLGLSKGNQGELLMLAEEQKWSVSELRRQASIRRGGSGKSGRPPLPGSRKAISRLTTAVVALEEAYELVETSAHPDEATRAQLLDNLRSCAALVNTLESMCLSQRARAAQSPTSEIKKSRANVAAA